MFQIQHEKFRRYGLKTKSRLIRVSKAYFKSRVKNKKLSLDDVANDDAHTIVFIHFVIDRFIRLDPVFNAPNGLRQRLDRVTDSLRDMLLKTEAAYLEAVGDLDDEEPRILVLPLTPPTSSSASSASADSISSHESVASVMSVSAVSSESSASSSSNSGNSNPPSDASPTCICSTFCDFWPTNSANSSSRIRIND